MNMKKTIAALSAAAVAVSAMATTVSADETATNGGTLVYNLVKEVKVTNAGTATISGEASGISLTAGSPLVITVDPDGLFDISDVEYTITVTQNSTSQLKIFSGLTPKNSSWVSDAGVVTIPVADSITDGLDSSAFDTAANGGVRVNVSIKANSVTAGMDQDDFNDATLADDLTISITGDAADAMADKATVSGWADGDNVSTVTLLGTYTTSYTAADLQADEITDLLAEIQGVIDAASAIVTPNTVVTTSDDTKDYYPMYSSIAGKDVINWLEADTLIDEDGNTLSCKTSYINVIPVINDAIANYDNVTFTFNTATQKIKDGKYDSDGSDYYMTFGQHLYDSYWYGTENSGFVTTTNNWAFNLFSGGLSINNGYTMSLNDTDVFDYGANSISFDWDSIAGGKVTNAKYLLTSMELYTSREWYWDAFTVAYSNDEAEDAESGEGVEGEEAIVDETAEDAEEITEEAPADETEEAPADAENPATGNASVALAVIPVALAAAAIVAKKRG